MAIAGARQSRHPRAQREAGLHLAVSFRDGAERQTRNP
jgi:hypothetical protein